MKKAGRLSTGKAMEYSSSDATMRAEVPTIGADDAVPLDLRYPGGKGLAGLQQWICSLRMYFGPAVVSRCARAVAGLFSF